MKITKKDILKHLLIPIIVGMGIGIFLTFAFNWRDHLSWPFLAKQMFYSAILSLLFWKGNELITRSFWKKKSWLEGTRLNMAVHIIISLTYSLAIILLFYLYLWFILMHRQSMFGFYKNFQNGIYVCFSINLIVTFAIYSRIFFINWKESVMREEGLKRESLALQYESLKNQVNPHFLFNSLNVLTSLIERDRDASINYVKQLSDVFRYVLDQNVKETVPINTELKFINSYIYLQQIRFGETLNISISVTSDFYIVPMALQILLENAIKHNENSVNYPLQILIFEEGQYLIVKNSKQARKSLPDSTQVGLKNLESQYEFLSGEKIVVLNEAEFFIVKLPKIKNENYASAGN
jgi:sensor histidine kinase YesM